MPDENNIISVQVTGLDILQMKLVQFPTEIQKSMEAAGNEVGKEILGTVGLRKYPPETAANKPPLPYYVRGQGTQTRRGNKGNSERYGTQFYVESVIGKTTIGNRASYARFLGGAEQAKAMGRIGWRKLFDVAKEKLPQIKEIYQKWINYTIKKLGL
jgi:hypothetical protein